MLKYMHDKSSKKLHSEKYREKNAAKLALDNTLNNSHNQGKEWASFLKNVLIVRPACFFLIAAGLAFVDSSTFLSVLRNFIVFFCSC